MTRFGKLVLITLVPAVAMLGCGRGSSSSNTNDAPYPVRWGIDPLTRPLSPETTTLAALVSDTRCTGGRNPEGRMLQPEITYDETSVRILIKATPLPPGAYPCPGAQMPASLTIVLDEPLGDRQLIDLSAP
jgi:hypothetical protein